MYEGVSASVRRIIIKSRCIAMCGSLDIGLAEMSAAVEQIESNWADVVALCNARAELMFLSGEYADAIEELTKTISSNDDRMSPALRHVLETNRNETAGAASIGDYVSEHSRLYDRLSLVGSGLTDYRVLLNAEYSAEAEQHYDAVPALWREYKRTFTQGCWQVNRHVCSRLSREFLRIGSPVEAAYYSVIALDDKLAAGVGKQLIVWRDIDAIRSVISKVLRVANLASHAVTACNLLTELAEGIPDAEIDDVFDWLISWAKLPPKEGWGPSAPRAAWRAVTAIAHRLNRADATELISMAIQHPCWHAPSVDREALVEMISPCISSVELPKLEEVARALLPLALDQRSDIDYGHVINTLCHIADQYDGELKPLIGDALYPEGQPINSILAQVAEHYGKKLNDASAFERLCRTVMRDVELQVQRVTHGTESINPSSHSAKSEVARGDITTVVYLGAQHGLNALVRHRDSIPDQTLTTLVNAVLDKIADTDNMIANRINLSTIIGRFSDVLSPELSQVVFDRLSPLAKGQVSETDGTILESSNHPLSRFRISVGSVDELQGACLIALAQVVKRLTESYQGEVAEMIEHGLASAERDVRRLSIIAAHRMPTLSTGMITGLILATRDPDANIAKNAFLVFAHKPELHLPTMFQGLLAQSLTLAQTSQDASIRFGAASAANHLVRAETDLPSTLEKTVEAFRTDVSKSVRSVFETE